MYIENSTNYMQPTSTIQNLNLHRETFHDIFHRTLNNKSNSRPPKIELNGVLIPFNKVIRGQFYEYKLETDSKDYFLTMSSALSEVAHKIEWEVVTVKGVLDIETNVFDVEKISLSKLNDPSRFVDFYGDPYFDVDTYERTIAQRGKLEPAFDDLAS